MQGSTGSGYAEFVLSFEDLCRDSSRCYEEFFDVGSGIFGLRFWGTVFGYHMSFGMICGFDCDLKGVTGIRSPADLPSELARYR